MAICYLLLHGELPNDVWFIVSQEAGGVWLLGLAGVVMLAASMGHTDGNIQATGAQIANDLIGNYWKLDQAQLIVMAKIGMFGLTVLSAWLACLDLLALFSLGVLAYQGIIQLAVPQFLGIFWKRGNRYGWWHAGRLRRRARTRLSGLSPVGLRVDVGRRGLGLQPRMIL